MHFMTVKQHFPVGEYILMLLSVSWLGWVRENKLRKTFWNEVKGKAIYLTTGQTYILKGSFWVSF